MNTLCHKPLTTKTLALGTGLLTGLLITAPLLADDTEIYVNSAALAEKPNVLFLLDNSGSMDSTLQAPVDYDPAETYAGDFDPAYVYWSADGSVPSDPTSQGRFAIADNQCNASISSLANYGLYADRAAAWHVDASGDGTRNAWELINALGSGTQIIECQADLGSHGNGGAGVYPSDGTTGPWSTLPEAAIDWDSSGGNYAFYSANFLNYKANPTIEWRTRLEVLRSVVGELAHRLNNVNVGLMWFSDLNPRYTNDESKYEGGYVASAMADIDVPANRQAFLDALLDSGVPSDTNTPLSETLYEAYQYYSGGAVTFGLSEGVSVAGALDPSAAVPTYQSPITGECQSNAIVLMTDGLPTSDNNADDDIAALPNFAAITGSAECLDEHSSGDHQWDGRCLDELAQVMASPLTDLRTDLPNAQNVQTYAIGFQVDARLLRATAQKGGTEREFNTTNAEELAAAFASILDDIENVPRTFNAPGVSVDGFSRLVNRNSLYFSMFQPELRPQWEGNLKKYRLAFDDAGGAYISDSREDSNPNVVDPDTGEFIDSARSYWSASVDGNEPLQGGVRDKLSDARLPSRRVWTDIDPSLALGNSANRLSEDNASISLELLGIPDATADYRSQVLQWARGVNVRQEVINGSVTASRHSVGDPLHSQPVVVQYGGSADNPQLVIFFTTNDGYLHAIDEATGEELFSFVPKDLLPRLPQLYQNVGTEQRPYGLDGAISVEVIDRNGNGVIEPGVDPDTSDRVLLYFGMRRGGYNYYGLDVSNAGQATPSARLMWTIRGGLDAASGGTPGYAELGQTWSQPAVRKIRLNGVERRVLVFAGGYDPHQDSANTSDSRGRGIFIADADTGERLWAAGNFTGDPVTGEGAADLLLGDDMSHSIPSRVAAFDIDSDGLMDRLYVGDMAAQLWRIDFDPDNSGAATLARGGRIAALGGADAADQRRFYYPPDAALVTDVTGAYLALVIGSGYRAHPLDESASDRIYMLRDSNVFSAPASYTSITETDLFDATDNTIGEGTDAARASAVQELQRKQGWLLRLAGSGEKALSASLIVNGVALVPTFTPNAPTASDDPCGVRNGSGAVYYLNLIDATPKFNFDEVGTDSELTFTDRKLQLLTPGIPPETAFILTEQSGEVTNTILHGKEVGEDPSGNAAVRTYWFEE